MDNALFGAVIASWLCGAVVLLWLLLTPEADL